MTMRCSVWQDIPVDSKVIEVGATNPELGRLLLDRGFSNYFGLVNEKNAENFRDIEPALASHFHRLVSPSQIWTNNADVLIFTGYAGCYLLSPKYYRHAKYLLIRTDHILSSLLTLPVLSHYLLRKGLKLQTFQRAGGTLGLTQWLIATQVNGTQRFPSRYYLNVELGIQGFFEWLKKENIQYAVLRWFEDLPVVEPGEDIDILIASEDCSRVKQMLLSNVGTIPIDLYSTNGLPETDYRGMAYYPPQLATQLLNNRVLHRGIFYIPNPKHHLLSLAYHVVYHKGLRSGLPLNKNIPCISHENAEHDYGSVLSKLACDLGDEVEVTLEGLAVYLKNNGWDPPADTKAKLQIYANDEALKTQNVAIDPKNGELVVYILREYATNEKLIDKILRLLEWFGMEIVFSTPLTLDLQAKAAREIRGGNWGKWNAEIHPGGPSHVVVAFDYNPLPVKNIYAAHPLVKNEHFFIKDHIRNYFNPGKPLDERINFIHSSDNEDIAWGYIHLLFPVDRVEELNREIKGRREAYQTKERVISRLDTHGTRSKIELINFHGKPAIKKTFSPSYLRFLEREKFVMREFSRECSAIPPLLGSGYNYVVFPFYDDMFKFEEQEIKCIPPYIAKTALDLLRFFYKKGYAFIDFNPRCILVDRNDGVKIVDFEFLHKYKTIPSTFEESYDLVGLPNDFDGDRVPFLGRDVTYDEDWKPYIRSSLEQWRIRLYLKKRKLKKQCIRVLQVLWHKFKRPAKMMLNGVYSFFLKRRFGLPIEE